MSNMPVSTASKKLISHLLQNDTGLRDVVGAFVDELDGRIEEFCRAYANLDWDLLGMLAHRLKGAGGSYGYPDLSEIGAMMETNFRAQRAEDFTNWMRQLAELAAAAKAGLKEA